MKTLANKTTELAKDAESKMTYADLVKVCVNQPPKDGFTAEEMRSRFRLIDVCDKATDTLDFEDADCSKVKELVDAMKWAVIHKDLITFCEDVKAL